MPLITTTPFKSNTLNYTQTFEFISPLGSDNFASRMDAGAIDGTAIMVGHQLSDTLGIDAGLATSAIRSGDGYGTFVLSNPGDITTGDLYGLDIELNDLGTRAFVGCRGDNPSAVNNAGTIRYLTRVGSVWTQQQEISPGFDGPNQLFGTGIGTNSDGTVLAGGATLSDIGGTNTGNTYVFNAVGSPPVYTEIQTLTPSVVTASDFFGNSVEMAGTGRTLFIFARNNAVSSNSGAVWIWTESGGTWTEIQKLQSDTPEVSGLFGVTMSATADGKTLAIGTAEAAGGTNRGAFYVYEAVGSPPVYTKVQRITSPNSSDSEFFGETVAINSTGTRIAVTARGYDGPGGTNQGGIYVYQKVGSTWEFSSILTRTGAAASQFFGGSRIVITNDGLYIIASAQGNAGGAIVNGAITVFKET